MKFKQASQRNAPSDRTSKNARQAYIIKLIDQSMSLSRRGNDCFIHVFHFILPPFLSSTTIFPKVYVHICRPSIHPSIRTIHFSSMNSPRMGGQAFSHCMYRRSKSSHLSRPERYRPSQFPRVITDYAVYKKEREAGCSSLRPHARMG